MSRLMVAVLGIRRSGMSRLGWFMGYAAYRDVRAGTHGILDMVLKVGGADIARAAYGPVRLYDRPVCRHRLTVRLYTYG